MPVTKSDLLVQVRYSITIHNTCISYNTPHYGSVYKHTGWGNPPPVPWALPALATFGLRDAHHPSPLICSGRGLAPTVLQPCMAHTNPAHIPSWPWLTALCLGLFHSPARQGLARPHRQGLAHSWRLPCSSPESCGMLPGCLHQAAWAAGLASPLLSVGEALAIIYLPLTVLVFSI